MDGTTNRFVRGLTGRSWRRGAAGARGSALAATLTSPCFEVIASASLGRPTLCVVIDTEADFDWTGPFSRHGYSLRSVGSLHLMQDLLALFGIRPMYLVDYPVAADAGASRTLRRLFEAGSCELGVQMHPWTTPPFEEVLCERNSYPCNLPKELQRAKLETLVAVTRRNFGIEPRAYKAGRYGFDDNGAALLEEFGFEVDTSVMPFTSFQARQGPDFRDVPAFPFWFGRSRPVLELPVTRNFAGLLGERLGRRLYPWLDSAAGRRFRLAGVFARGRLIDRLMLSPEGMRLDELKSLTRALVRRGQRLLTFSFHSSSLAPGNTPYVRTQAALDELLARTCGFLEYFIGELDGQVMSVSELHGFFRERRTNS